MPDDTNDTTPDKEEDENGFVLYVVCTRADALADGTRGRHRPGEASRDQYPDRCHPRSLGTVRGADARGREGGQTTSKGRLWDIVWMFRCAVLRNPDEREIEFELTSSPTASSRRG